MGLSLSMNMKQNLPLFVLKLHVTTIILFKNYPKKIISPLPKKNIHKNAYYSGVYKWLKNGTNINNQLGNPKDNVISVLWNTL